MKKLFRLILFFFIVGCAGGQVMTADGRPVYSVSDTSNCQYIKSEYILAMPYNMIQGVQANVVRAGGNSYKITSTSSTRMSYTDMVHVNYEIWKCKESGSNNENIVK